MSMYRTGLHTMQQKYKVSDADVQKVFRLSDKPCKSITINGHTFETDCRRSTKSTDEYYTKLFGPNGETILTRYNYTN